MNKCKKEIDQLRMNEIMSRAEKIEKDLGLSEEIEFSEEEMEILKAYEASKKENAQAQDYDYREEPEKNITEITDYKKKKEKKKRFLHLSQKAQRSIAMLVIGVLCVGAASMTSQANRQWVVERLKYTTGNNEVVIQIGDGEKNEYEDLELKAIEETEKMIGIKMPRLFYKPQGTALEKYTISFERKKVIFLYKNNERNIFLRASREEDIKEELLHLYGDEEDRKTIKHIGFDIEYSCIEDDKGNTNYLAEWNDNGIYYQLIADYEKKEFLKIIQDLDYIM